MGLARVLDILLGGSDLKKEKKRKERGKGKKGGKKGGLEKREREREREKKREINWWKEKEKTHQIGDALESGSDLTRLGLPEVLELLGG